MNWEKLLSALSILLLFGTSSALAAPITGNGTSTFIAVYSSATTIAGFANFTFNSSAALLTVNGTTTLLGLTFTNATGTSLNLTTLAFTSASGTNISVTGSGSFPTLNFVNASGTNIAVTNVSTTNITASGSLTVGTPVGVPSGGTGASSYSYGVVIASSTNAFATIAPGTSGNVLTSNGTTWTSQAVSTGPSYAARAYSSANPILGTPTSTVTALPLDVEDFDDSGSYNTSTYQYTAPVSGTYSSVAQARWNGTSDGNLYQVGTAKNGSLECYVGSIPSVPGAGAALTLASPCIFKMSAGDTAQLQVWYNDANPRPFDAGRTDTYFVITRLGN